MSEIKATKGWTLKAADGVRIRFTPVFVINNTNMDKVKVATDSDVECTMINAVVRDSTGKETNMDIPYQEFYMFIYYCANEELRQKMLLHQQKKITEIPYEVTFKLDKGEMMSGMAKRLIKLPVEEITMAVIRSEAQLLDGKVNLSKVNDWFNKRQQQRKGRNKLLEGK